MPDEMNKREVILTIREYENSVAMPEGERVTYLDPRGGVHLKDGDDKASDYTGHAAKCAEYLRFGDEVDAVTCGEYPPFQRGQVLRYAGAVRAGRVPPAADALHPTPPARCHPTEEQLRPPPPWTHR